MTDDTDLDIVKEVIDPKFRSGVSQKTGKEWVIRKISLNSGKEAQTFDEVEAGDTVKMTYNEEYKSWNAAKPRKTDTQHDDVMKALRQVYLQGAEILKLLKQPEIKQPESQGGEDAPW